MAFLYFSSNEVLEEKRKRIEQAKYEAGMKCRIEIQDGTIVEVNEDAQLHFVKFETRQIDFFFFFFFFNFFFFFFSIFSHISFISLKINLNLQK